MSRTMRDRKRETGLGQQRIAGDRRNSVRGRNSRDGLRRRSFRKLLRSWVDGVTKEEKVESVVDEMFLYKSSLCIYRTHP